MEALPLVPQALGKDEKKGEGGREGLWGASTQGRQARASAEWSLKSQPTLGQLFQKAGWLENILEGSEQVPWLRNYAVLLALLPSGTTSRRTQSSIWVPWPKPSALL